MVMGAGNDNSAAVLTRLSEIPHAGLPQLVRTICPLGAFDPIVSGLGAALLGQSCLVSLLDEGI